MAYKKLTEAEERRLAEAFTAQAKAMGIAANKTLPKEIKKQVREKVLRAIQDERNANQAQEERRKEYEKAENTFIWKSAPRRQ